MGIRSLCSLGVGLILVKWWEHCLVLSKDWEEVSLGPDATFLLLSGLLLLPGGQLGSHHSVVVVVKALTRGKW